MEGLARSDHQTTDFKVLHEFTLSSVLQRSQNFFHVTFHDLRELIKGQIDAVVAQSALGKVVGSNPVGAVATADEAFAGCGLFQRTLESVLFLYPSQEHLHGLGFVAVLRAVILALGDDACRQMGHAHC